MKKLFEAPEVSIHTFDVEDIITASFDDDVVPEATQPTTDLGPGGLPVAP